jgi:hypothetical protein
MLLPANGEAPGDTSQVAAFILDVGSEVLAEKLEEGFLGDVFGVCRVADDGIGDAVDESRVPLDHLSKRSLRFLDQRNLVFRQDARAREPEEIEGGNWIWHHYQ